jgi:hypothetical protein
MEVAASAIKTFKLPFQQAFSRINYGGESFILKVKRPSLSNRNADNTGIRSVAVFSTELLRGRKKYRACVPYMQPAFRKRMK